MTKRDSPSFELKIFGTLRYPDRFKQSLLAFVVIIAVAGLGITLLHGSRAATPVVAVEAEGGTISSAATTVTDATASGGKAIQFGSASSATGGGGSSSCVNSTSYPASYPNNCTTGVPAGTTLTAYTGSLSISSCGTVISDAIINGNLSITASNGTTSASTPCVTIKDSLINGYVYTGSSPGATGPLVMTDDEVNAPNNTDRETIGNTNFYLERVNQHGGANGGIDCAGYCSISDSWTHDFYNLAGHYDAIISNGNNDDSLVINHNSINCDYYAYAANANGGCSADLGLFGDFSQIGNVTVTNNFFAADSYAADIAAGSTPAYCAYGGSSEQPKPYPDGINISFTGNVFQRGPTNKCGLYGPIADFNGGTNDTWTNNSYSDGTVIPAN